MRFTSQQELAWVNINIKLKEDHVNIKIILERLQYHVHGWTIGVNLKMVKLLLGMQIGYIKCSCFLLLLER